MLDIKQILAENLTELLDSRPDISRLNLSKQIHVADGTLGRIKYGTGNPTIEVLEQIARFFKIEAWQLLHPGLGRNLLPKPGKSTTEPPQETIADPPSVIRLPKIPQEGDMGAVIAKAVEEAVRKILEERERIEREQQKAG